jgi:hypothetical protein
MPMLKLSAARKVTRATLFAASVPTFASPSLSVMAQQSAATIRSFQSGNPSAVYRYYWWHDSCYVRYQSGNYQSVASDYCQH